MLGEVGERGREVGAELLPAMLGGRVTAGVSGYGEFESQIKAGKLRALAISSGKRLAGADVPTLKEQGMDVEVVNWRAIMAPPAITADQRKAHAETVEKLVKTGQLRSVQIHFPDSQRFLRRFRPEDVDAYLAAAAS